MPRATKVTKNKKGVSPIQGQRQWGHITPTNPELFKKMLSFINIYGWEDMANSFSLACEYVGNQLVHDYGNQEVGQILLTKAEQLRPILLGNLTGRNIPAVASGTAGKASAMGGTTGGTGNVGGTALTDQQVVEIRERYSEGVDPGVLIKEYNLSDKGYLSRLITGVARRSAGGPIQKTNKRSKRATTGPNVRTQVSGGGA